MCNSHLTGVCEGGLAGSLCTPSRFDARAPLLLKLASVQIGLCGPYRSRSCSSIAGAVKQEPRATLWPTVAVQFVCSCLCNIKAKDNKPVFVKDVPVMLSVSDGYVFIQVWWRRCGWPCLQKDELSQQLVCFTLIFNIVMSNLRLYWHVYFSTQAKISFSP